MEIPDFPQTAQDLVKFERKDLIQLHGAYKCMQRETGMLQDEPWQCHIVRCQDMRRVVKHMMLCPSDKKCSWPVGCSLMRQEIKRLVSCEEKECPICIQKKEWQMSLSEEQRSNLIDLLVQTTSNSSSIFDGNRHLSLHQKVLYIKSIEGEIYTKAENMTDYYRILAAKKWRIKMYIKESEKNRRRYQANLEERRRVRRGVYRPYIPINARGAGPEQPD